MSEDLQKFSFKGHSLRIFPTDDGLSFYAIAKDATSALGYRSASDALRRIPDKHKGTRLVRTPGGMQDLLCIDESGLYRLVLRSDKPEAEPFMDWVTSDVLPTIRIKGSYTLQPANDAPQLAQLQSENTQLKQQLDALQAHSQALQTKYTDILEYKVAQLERQAGPTRKRKASPPISDSEKQIMRDLHAQGLSLKAIAKETGRSSAAISFIVRGAA